jgi:hypothetical protein
MFIDSNSDNFVGFFEHFQIFKSFFTWPKPNVHLLKKR